MMRCAPFLLGLVCCATASVALAQSGEYFSVEYAPSEVPGELIYGVTYTAWIPEGAGKLRGVIVHQHGCGTGACQGGATAAYDLHWQALAAKWDCALLGPSYHQVDGQDCRKWCDPRNGSGATYLRALEDLAAKSGHRELAAVPWCLWGHSGGAFWASLMQTMHPERIAAIWFRSGTGYSAWEKGEIAKPEVPKLAYSIPMMCNPGAKENGDSRFRGAWDGAMAMFKAYRAQGALIGFAPDPRTAHECGDSRYLAIPFFDACLAMRLPEVGSAQQTLRPADESQAYLAELLGGSATAAADFSGAKAEAVWLPNRAVAAAWQQYVQTGATEDLTPPQPPTDVCVLRRDAGTDAEPDASIEVTWRCVADFESGLQQCLILRDGQEIGRVPEKPLGKFGRPLFQSMSYHDTPEAPLPQMRFIDTAPLASGSYEIVAVNSVGGRSAPSAKSKAN